MSLKHDRLDELLALEATQGLAPADAAELDALLAQFPDEDPDGLELAAAAIHLSLIGPREPLPADLAERLELTAVAMPSVPVRLAKPRPSRAWVAWSGWAVAASLACVLAFALWPKKEPTLAELRDRLRPQAVAFAAADKPGLSGEVLWSTAKQEGYLELKGLPPLDPSKEQYQLWIVDPTKKQPVDGGVFDVRPDGTALVRVRAPIRVGEANAFAVTKEVAGGVVVSDGPHLLVLKPKSG
ncbi:anti-sigma factor [Gemmata sp. JC717]|uniref:Anti-sigma factor n=1 Tax=Gemmata algarum TaxID=2975278 RepID=A0ABU5F588_9BACT|nr:anti-sigma factor [Gemmata algarum]MDY3557187.1 anti-sigma factor [Gemmata algarum]MDY3562339.1 anti-sigma factor [Gemmata algarum]